MTKDDQIESLQKQLAEVQQVLSKWLPIELLKIKLQKENPDLEYEIYTAQRKCGDPGDDYEGWDYVEFHRGDYIEQMLFSRQRQAAINATKGK